MIPKYILDKLAKMEAVRRATAPATAVLDYPLMDEAHVEETLKILAEYGQFDSVEDLVFQTFHTRDADVVDAMRQVLEPPQGD